MADVYPASDYDRAKRVLGVLGSFWTRTFTRPEQVRSYTDAKCQLETQTYQDTLEAVAALSRFTVPLGQLKTGDVFGEMALLKNSRTTAMVTAQRPATVLFLAREYVGRIVQAVPEIRSYLEALAEDREIDNQLVMGEDDIPSDERVLI